MAKSISAAVAIALALTIGCSGDNEAEAPATTQRPTTTVAPSPEEAFVADYERQVDGETPAGSQAALGLAQNICNSLETNAAIAADNAASDTPASDQSVIEAANGMTISAAFTGETPDAVVAVILRTGSNQLCPAHSDTINATLASLGL